MLKEDFKNNLYLKVKTFNKKEISLTESNINYKQIYVHILTIALPMTLNCHTNRT